MSTAPPERTTGQDDEPPDVLRAVVVAMVLIGDMGEHIEQHDDGGAADLLLRAGAVLTILRAVRNRLRYESHDGE